MDANLDWACDAGHGGVDVIARADAAFGIRWVGLHDPLQLLAGTGSRQVTVASRRLSGSAPTPTRPTTARAVFETIGFTLELDADPLRLVAHAHPGAQVADLVHPGLAQAAAIVSAWLGRTPLQGGAVLTPAGSAVAVLGATRAGKSTLLASLAAAGRPVLCDELVVVDEGCVAAGPRQFAVRRPGSGAAQAWQGAATLVPRGDGPSTAPLAGWVSLAWGPSLALEPLGTRDRAAVLGAHRLHGDLQPDAAPFLDLLALPGWRLTRPRDVAALPASVELLVDGPLAP